MKLDRYEIEDIEDILAQVESSFNIKFEDDELVSLKTLGDLFDHIKEKIKLIQVTDCTTQQAFYKFRCIIESELDIDRKQINTTTPLEKIFPRKSRKQRTKKIEQELGFELKILRPPHFITISLLLLLLASFVGLFIMRQYGLIGLGVSIFGLWVASKLGNELDLKTVGQVAEKMTRENYLKTRRNSETFNSNEIEKILLDWVSEILDKPNLIREVKLG